MGDQRFAFIGSACDDEELRAALPTELRHVLDQANGFVAFSGGLHVRGACREPLWHSLRHVWTGERAFHARYQAVRAGDIPFAQDAVGDQWLLRDGRVARLSAETGDLDESNKSLSDFFAAVDQDPMEALGLHPLMQFTAEGGSLAPGQLLNVYPPFCAAQSAEGVSLGAVPTLERLDFLADLARQLPPDGGSFHVKFTD